MASRRDRLAARGPYQAAVLPLIAQAIPHLPTELLAEADDATAELARFDAEVGTVTAPFDAILLRSESASSSEIEQLTASAKQITLAEIGASRSHNAHLIVSNVKAMNTAIELADDISTASIIRMHEALLKGTHPEFTGHFRDQQVWIGGRISPHTAAFVPPHHDRVETLMEDLVAFMQRADIPVLVHAALAHAQFETIHPFPDGNGRTGRALIHTLLRHGGVTRNVAIPLSAGLLSTTDRYFEALTAYRSGNVVPIVSAVVDAAFFALHHGKHLMADLSNLESRWNESIQARRDSGAARLGQLLLKQPMVSVAVVSDHLKISAPAAQTAINRFVDAGILTQTNAARRNRIWAAKEVLAALDAFSERARRGIRTR